MTISACIIVKNEWEDLKRCVGSLEGHVDEVVIATEPYRVKKARMRVGLPFVRVIGHAWTNDFAAARNATLAAASGDWLLVIDADEVLDGDLRELVRQLPDSIDCCYVTQMNFADHEGNIGSKADVFRLLRNHVGWRYEGRTHEQPVVPGKVPKFATQDGVTLFHWGYLPERMAVKHVRNLELLRRSVEDEPESIFAHFNLGGQHLSNQDFHEALGPFTKAIGLWERQGQPELAFVPTLFVYAIAAAFRSAQFEDAVSLAAKAPKQAFTPDYFYYAGLAAAELGLREDARELLTRGRIAIPDRHFHEAAVPALIDVALAKLG